MKKIISILSAVALLLSVFSFPSFAEDYDILINGIHLEGFSSSGNINEFWYGLDEMPETSSELPVITVSGFSGSVTQSAVKEGGGFAVTVNCLKDAYQKSYIIHFREIITAKVPVNAYKSSRYYNLDNSVVGFIQADAATGNPPTPRYGYFEFDVSGYTDCNILEYSLDAVTSYGNNDTIYIGNAADDEVSKIMSAEKESTSPTAGPCYETIGTIVVPASNNKRGSYSLDAAKVRINDNGKIVLAFGKKTRSNTTYIYNDGDNPAFLVLKYIKRVVEIVETVEDLYNIGTPYIEMEAEDGTIKIESSNDLFPNPLMVIEDSAASNGRALQSACGTDNGVAVSTLPSFRLKREGYYNMWMRCRKEDDHSRSINIFLNDTLYEITEMPSKSYTWVKVNRGKTIYLNKGINKIGIGNRGFRATIDKIVLTNSDVFNPNVNDYVPKDIWAKDYQNQFAETRYPISVGHPRVLLNSTDIPKIKENLTKSVNNELYLRMKKQIAKNIDCTLPSSYNKGGTDNQNLDYLEYIAYNALEYVLFGTGECGQKSIEEMINYLDSLIYQGNNMSDYSVVQNTAMFYAALVYDWCYPLLTDIQKETIVKLCISHMANSEIGWPPVREKAYFFGHSTEQSLMRDALAFSIAVYDEFPDAYNCVSERIFDEFIPVFNNAYESGSAANSGTFYGIALRAQWEFYMTWLLDKIGYKDRISAKQSEKMYEILYQRRPDGALMKDGDDNSSRGVYYPTVVPMFLAGNLFKNPMFIQEMYNAGECSSSVADYMDSMGMGPIFLILNDPDIGFESTNRLPLSHWGGKNAGIMTARSSWDMGYSANSAVVTMKMPERFYDGHQHLDAGEFEIYYKGNLLLDSGDYYSFGNAHDYGYNKQTIAHNCMLIYDPSERNYYGDAYPSMGGQYSKFDISKINSFEDSQSDTTKFSEVLGYGFGNDLNKPEYTYLKGDLTNCYDGKVKDYTRTFMFNNTFNEDVPALLFVMDKVTSTDPSYKKSFLIHSEGYPLLNDFVNIGKRTIVNRNINYEFGYKDSGKLVMHTLLPELDNLETNTVGGSNQNRFMVGDTNYPGGGANGASTTVECGYYRVEMSPKTQQETDYFLNVMQVTTYGKYNYEDNTIHKYDTGDYLGASCMDRVVFMKKEKTRLDSFYDFSYDLSGKEKVLLQIDGLSAGTWKLTGATTDEIVNVPESSGVLAIWTCDNSIRITKLNDAFVEINYGSYENKSEADNIIPTILDGKFIFSGLNPININGILYSAAEDIAKYLGSNYMVTYDGDKIRFTVKNLKSSPSDSGKGEHYVEFTKNSFVIYRNSYSAEGTFLDSVEGWYFAEGKPVEKDGKIFLPLSSLNKITSIATMYNPTANILEYSMNKFNPTDSNMVVKVLMHPEYFNQGNYTYLFGKINKKIGGHCTDYDNLSIDRYGFTIEDSSGNRRDYPAIVPYGSDYFYGVGFIGNSDFLSGNQYFVTPYVFSSYKGETIKYEGETLTVSKEAE